MTNDPIVKNLESTGRTLFNNFNLKNKKIIDSQSKNKIIEKKITKKYTKKKEPFTIEGFQNEPDLLIKDTAGNIRDTIKTTVTTYNNIITQNNSIKQNITNLDEKSKYNTNNQNIKYTTEQIEQILNINMILIIIYLFLFVIYCYLIFFKKNISNTSKGINILFLILYPFLIYTVELFIYYIYEIVYKYIFSIFIIENGEKNKIYK
jgi:hypothetical protein